MGFALVLSLAAADSGSRALVGAPSPAYSQWKPDVAGEVDSSVVVAANTPSMHGSFAITRPLHEKWFNHYRSLTSGVFSSAFDESHFGEYFRSNLHEQVVSTQGKINVSKWLQTQGQFVHHRFLSGATDFVRDAIVRYGDALANNSGFVRQLDVDYRSEVGGRKWAGGVSAIGSLHETNKDAVAWQLRSYGADDASVGVNAGVLYRFIPRDTDYLIGANTFIDFEDGDYGDFYRWSFGVEVRSKWVDVFANFYNPISDSQSVSNGNTTYTAYTKAGNDFALHLHAPEARWLSGGLTYYSWQGEHGDDDDDGLRYHLFADAAQLPVAIRGLQLHLEYDRGGDSGGQSLGGGFTYRHYLNTSDSGVAPRVGESFLPQNYFYASAVREHTQRIGVREQRIAGEVGMRTIAETAVYRNMTEGDRADITIPLNNESLEPVTTFVAEHTVAISTNASGEVALVRQGAFEIDIRSRTSVTYHGASKQLGIERGSVYYRTAGQRTINQLTTAMATIHLIGTEVLAGYNPSAPDRPALDAQVVNGEVGIDIPVANDALHLNLLPPPIPESGSNRATVHVHHVDGVGVTVTTTRHHFVVHHNTPDDERYNVLRLLADSARINNSIYYVDYEHTGAIATLSVAHDNHASFVIESGGGNALQLSSDGVLGGVGGGIVLAHNDIAVKMNLLQDLSDYYGKATLQVIPRLYIADAVYGGVVGRAAINPPLQVLGGSTAGVTYRIHGDAQGVQFADAHNGVLSFANNNHGGARTLTLTIVAEDIADPARNHTTATLTIIVREGLSLARTNFEVLAGSSAVITLVATGSDFDYTINLADNAPAGVSKGAARGVQNRKQIINLNGSNLLTANERVIFAVTVSDGAGNELPDEVVVVTVDVLANVVVDNLANIPNPAVVYDMAAASEIFVFNVSGGRADDNYAANIISGNDNNRFAINPNSRSGVFALVANRADHVDGDVVITFESADGFSVATATITIASVPVVSIAKTDLTLTAVVNNTNIGTITAEHGKAPLTWQRASGDSDVNVAASNGDSRIGMLTFNRAMTVAGERSIVARARDSIGNEDSVNVRVRIVRGLGIEQTHYQVLAGSDLRITINAVGIQDHRTYTFAAVNFPANVVLGTQDGAAQPIHFNGNTAAREVRLTLRIDDAGSGGTNLDAIEREIIVNVVTPVVLANAGSLPAALTVYESAAATPVVTLTLAGGAGDYTHAIIRGGNILNILQGDSIVREQEDHSNRFTFTAPRRDTYTDGEEIVVEFAAADRLSTLTVTLTIRSISKVNLDAVDGQVYAARTDSTDTFQTIAAVNGKKSYTYAIVGDNPNDVVIDNNGNLSFASAATAAGDIVVTLRATDSVGNTATATITIRVEEILQLSNINTNEPSFYALAGNAAVSIATLTISGGDSSQLRSSGSSDASYLSIASGSTDGEFVVAAVANQPRLADSAAAITIEIWDSSSSVLPTLTLTVGVDVINSVAVVGTIPNPLPVYNLVAAEDVLTITISGGAGAYTHNIINGGINFNIRSSGISEFVLAANANATHGDGNQIAVEFAAADALSTATLTITLNAIPAVNIADARFNAVVGSQSLIGNSNVAISGGRAPYTLRIDSNDSNNPVQFVNGGNALQFAAAPTSTGIATATIRVRDANGNEDTAIVMVTILNRIALNQNSFYALSNGTYTFATLTAIGAGAGAYTFTPIGANDNISFVGTAGNDTQPLQIASSRTDGDELTFTLDISHASRGTERLVVTISIVATLDVQNRATIPNPLTVYNEVAAESVLTIRISGGAGAVVPAVSGSGSSGFVINQNGSARGEFILSANSEVTHGDGNLVVVELAAEDNLSSTTLTITLLAIPAVNVAAQSFDAVVGNTELIEGGNLIASDGRGRYAWSVVDDGSNSLTFASYTNPLRFATAPTTASTLSLTVRVQDEANNTADAAVVITIYERIALAADSFYALDNGTQHFATLTIVSAASGAYTFAAVGTNDNVALSGASTDKTQTLQVSGSRNAGNVLSFMLDISHATLPTERLNIAVSVVAPIDLVNVDGLPVALTVYESASDAAVVTLSLQGGAGAYTHNVTDGDNILNITQGQGDNSDEFIFTAPRRDTYTDAAEVVVEFAAADALSTLTVTLTINAISKVNLDSVDGQVYAARTGSTATFQTIAAANGKPSYTYAVMGNNPNNVAIDNNGNLSFSNAATAAGDIVVTLQATDSVGNTATATITIRVEETLRLFNIDTSEPSFYVVAGNDATNIATLTISGGDSSQLNSSDSSDASYLSIASGNTDGEFVVAAVANQPRLADSAAAITIEIWDSSSSVLPTLTLTVGVDVINGVAVVGTIPNPLPVYNLVAAEDVLTITISGGAGAYTASALGGNGGGGFTIAARNGSDNEFVLSADEEVSHSDGNVVIVEFAAADGLSTATLTITLDAILAVAIANQTFNGVIDSQTLIGNNVVVASDGRAPYVFSIKTNDSSNALEVINNNQLQFFAAPSVAGDAVITIQVTDAANNEDEAVMNITILTRIDLRRHSFYALDTGDYTFATLTAIGAGDGAIYTFTEASEPNDNISFAGTAGSNTQPLQIRNSRAAGDDLTFTLDIADSNGLFLTETHVVGVSVVASVALANVSGLPAALTVYESADISAVVTLSLQGGAGAYKHTVTAGDSVLTIAQGQGNYNDTFVFSAPRRDTYTDDAEVVVEFAAADKASTLTVTLTIRSIPEVNLDSVDGQVYAARTGSTDTFQTIAAANGKPSYTYAILSDNPNNVAIDNNGNLSFSNAATAAGDIVVTLQATDSVGNTATATITIRVEETLRLSNINTNAPFFYVVAGDNATNIATLTVSGGDSSRLNSSGSSDAAYLSIVSGSTDGEFVVAAVANEARSAGNLATMTVQVWDISSSILPTLTVAVNVSVVAPFVLTPTLHSLTLNIADDADSNFLTFSSEGGISPHTYSVVSSSPAGWQSLITLNASSGALSDNGLVVVANEHTRGTIIIRAQDSYTPANTQNASVIISIQSIPPVFHNPAQNTAPTLTVTIGSVPEELFDFEHEHGAGEVNYGIISETRIRGSVSLTKAFSLNATTGVLSKNRLDDMLNTNTASLVVGDKLAVVAQISDSLPTTVRTATATIYFEIAAAPLVFTAPAQNTAPTITLTTGSLPDINEAIYDFEHAGGFGSVTYALDSLTKEGADFPVARMENNKLLNQLFIENVVDSGGINAGDEFAAVARISDSSTPPLAAYATLHIEIELGTLAFANPPQGSAPTVLLSVGFLSDVLYVFERKGGASPIAYELVSFTDGEGNDLSAAVAMVSDGKLNNESLSDSVSIGDSLTAVVKASDSSEPPQTATATVYYEVVSPLHFTAPAPDALPHFTLTVGSLPPVDSVLYRFAHNGGGLPPFRYALDSFASNHGDSQSLVRLYQNGVFVNLAINEDSVRAGLVRPWQTITAIASISDSSPTPFVAAATVQFAVEPASLRFTAPVPNTTPTTTLTVGFMPSEELYDFNHYGGAYGFEYEIDTFAAAGVVLPISSMVRMGTDANGKPTGGLVDAAVFRTFINANQIAAGTEITAIVRVSDDSPTPMVVSATVYFEIEAQPPPPTFTAPADAVSSLTLTVGNIPDMVFDFNHADGAGSVTYELMSVTRARGNHALTDAFTFDTATGVLNKNRIDDIMLAGAAQELMAEDEIAVVGRITDSGDTPRYATVTVNFVIEVAPLEFANLPTETVVVSHSRINGVGETVYDFDHTGGVGAHTYELVSASFSSPSNFVYDVSTGAAFGDDGQLQNTGDGLGWHLYPIPNSFLRVVTAAIRLTDSSTPPQVVEATVYFELEPASALVFDAPDPNSPPPTVAITISNMPNEIYYFGFEGGFFPYDITLVSLTRSNGSDLSGVVSLVSDDKFNLERFGVAGGSLMQDSLSQHIAANEQLTAVVRLNDSATPPTTLAATVYFDVAPAPPPLIINPADGNQPTITLTIGRISEGVLFDFNHTGGAGSVRYSMEGTQHDLAHRTFTMDSETGEVRGHLHNINYYRDNGTIANGGRVGVSVAVADSAVPEPRVVRATIWMEVEDPPPVPVITRPYLDRTPTITVTTHNIPIEPYNFDHVSGEGTVTYEFARVARVRGNRSLPDAFIVDHKRGAVIKNRIDELWLQEGNLLIDGDRIRIIMRVVDSAPVPQTDEATVYLHLEAAPELAFTHPWRNQKPTVTVTMGYVPNEVYNFDHTGGIAPETYELLSVFRTRDNLALPDAFDFNTTSGSLQKDQLDTFLNPNDDTLRVGDEIAVVMGVADSSVLQQRATATAYVQIADAPPPVVTRPSGNSVPTITMTVGNIDDEIYNFDHTGGYAPEFYEMVSATRIRGGVAVPAALSVDVARGAVLKDNIDSLLHPSNDTLRAGDRIRILMRVVDSNIPPQAATATVHLRINPEPLAITRPQQGITPSVALSINATPDEVYNIDHSGGYAPVQYSIISAVRTSDSVALPNAFGIDATRGAVLKDQLDDMVRNGTLQEDDEIVVVVRAQDNSVSKQTRTATLHFRIAPEPVPPAFVNPPPWDYVLEVSKTNDINWQGAPFYDFNHVDSNTGDITYEIVSAQAQGPHSGDVLDRLEITNGSNSGVLLNDSLQTLPSSTEVTIKVRIDDGNPLFPPAEATLIIRITD